MKEFDPVRRKLIKVGAGAAGGLVFPSVLVRSAFADNYPALANYPEGVSGDSVFIGLTCDLTGVYSPEGIDQRKGYELAIEQINAGDSGIKKISPLTKAGVLGKTIKYGVADSETKPNTAVQAATRFIRENKAMLVAGNVSSAVAIALQKVCNREKTVFLTAISASNDTTGADCQRYGFRLCHTAYQSAKALAPIVGKALGKGKKAVYLVPDYTYGHTTRDSMKEFTAKEGWTFVGEQLHPLGTTDFSSYLINIANSGADVLVNIGYGADAVNSIRQAKQFGILDKMKLVVPYMSPFLGDAVGPELMEDVYGVTGFWWTLEDQYPIAKDFVQAFEAKYKEKPHDSAYIAYLNIALWADAIERAGTFYAPEVIKAYEQGVKREGPIGEVWYRGDDHQGAVNFLVVKGKKPSLMKNKDDRFDIVSIANGGENLPPIGHFGCKLGPYT